MKKVLSVIMVVLMLVTLNIPVFAEDIVVDSIEAKIAPELGSFEVQESGGESKKYSAIIADSQSGDMIQGVAGEAQKTSGDELVFYVTSLAESETAVIPEIKAALDNTMEQIKAVSKVTELGNGSVSKKVNEAIKKFNKDNSANIDDSRLVISDVFDASLVLNDATIQKLAAGQKCSFMFKPAFGKSDFCVLLHNTEGNTWEVVDDVEWVTVDGVDYIKVTVDHLSTFTLAVENKNVAPAEPGRSGFWWWWWILLIILVIIAAVVVRFCVTKNKAQNKKSNKK